MVSKKTIEFYVYFWLLEDGTPYYVGKGTKRRALNAHQGISRPPMRRIIVKECFDEKEALELEYFFIHLYGRRNLGMGCLHNLTSGGQQGMIGNKNALGHSPSLEARKIMGDAARNRSAESNERTRLARLGRKASEETRKKMSISQTGRTHSLETRRKISLARKKQVQEGACR